MVSMKSNTCVIVVVVYGWGDGMGESGAAVGPSVSQRQEAFFRIDALGHGYRAIHSRPWGLPCTARPLHESFSSSHTYTHTFIHTPWRRRTSRGGGRWAGSWRCTARRGEGCSPVFRGLCVCVCVCVFGGVCQQTRQAYRDDGGREGVVRKLPTPKEEEDRLTHVAVGLDEGLDAHVGAERDLGDVVEELQPVELHRRDAGVLHDGLFCWVRVWFVAEW